MMLDRNKVIDALEVCSGDKVCWPCPYYDPNDRRCEKKLKRDAIALLKEQEAVKHGQWIPEVTIANAKLMNVAALIKCSCCEKGWRTDYGAPYCPNCGAKMDMEGGRMNEAD